MLKQTLKRKSAVSSSRIIASRPYPLTRPDGYMSAQIQACDRNPFVGNDMYQGTAGEYVGAGRSYLAYSGRFFVDEMKGRLSHEMAVSFFPNWLGTNANTPRRIER